MEAGNSPAQAVDNLRKVLARLAEDPEIEIMKISEYVAEMGGAAQTLSDVTGQPDWMIAPSRARGYADWFDYNANAPELAYFRELYQAVSSRITQVEQAAASNPGALQLIKHARLSLAISQYEFAAVGAGGFDDAMWELARTALVPAFAAEAAAQGMDVNPGFSTSTQMELKKLLPFGEMTSMSSAPLAANCSTGSISRPGRKLSAVRTPSTTERSSITTAHTCPCCGTRSLCGCG